MLGICRQEGDSHFDEELRKVNTREGEDSPSSHCSKILSFGVVSPNREMNLPFYMASKEESQQQQQQLSFDRCEKGGGVIIASPRRRSRTGSHSQHHILAERRRREKLSLRFVTLSSLIPGLKKMDKASVLGEAIKHTKQLQERVKSLEEQTKNRSVESAVTVKKSHIFGDDEESSSIDDGCGGTPSPEIEVRVSDNNVLVRIHCANREGQHHSRILCEIQKLGLTIVNASSVQFANHSLDITVVAKINPSCVRTAKDFARELRSAV